MLTLIAALADNRAIGWKGDLIYHLSADLRRFKALTMGHTVVMGRRTFESLPKGALPHRRNIVLTRQQGWQAEGVEAFPSLDEALRACPNECVFIIGGASLYEEALPLAERLELTHIHDTPSRADVFFPEIDLSQWRIVQQEAHDGAPPFVFTTYLRNNP